MANEQDEIRALELAHDNAKEEHRKAKEQFLEMIQQAHELGASDPDGMLLAHNAHQRLRDAQTKLSESGNAWSWAVIRGIRC